MMISERQKKHDGKFSSMLADFKDLACFIIMVDSCYYAAANNDLSFDWPEYRILVFFLNSGFLL